jgi:hypothetical protein
LQANDTVKLMRIVEIIREENVSPSLLSSVDSVPDLPSANRVKDQHVVHRFVNKTPSQAPMRSDQWFRRFHDIDEMMMPPAQGPDQMSKPPVPNQEMMKTAVPQQPEIDNSLARMPIKELFDQKAPVRQVSQAMYQFQVDGKPFAVEFAPASPGSVEVVLSRQGLPPGENPFDTLHDMGTRSIVVYSTFVAICAKYLKVYHPSVMFWYGFNEDQQRLYDRLSGYLAKQAPEYVVQKQGITIGFVRRDLVQQQGQPMAEEFDLSREQVNRIEHDKMSRPNRRIRMAKAVAMPGNTSAYPAL